MPIKASQSLLALSLAVTVIVALASPAVAQRRRRDGARYYPVAPLRILETGGEIGFQYDYFSERESQDGGNQSRLTNHYFQEYVLGRTRGYVYHPRMMDFRAEAKLGLMQQLIARSGYPDSAGPESEANNGTITGYDLYAYFLKEHPVSFTAFANREQEPVLELFNDRYMVMRESQGGSVRWKNRVVPMSLAVTRTQGTEWGGDSVSHSQTDTVEYTARHQVANWMRTELRYRYQEYSQRFRADTPLLSLDRKTDLDSHTADLVNTLYLTSDKRSHLTSTLRYFKQRGTQDLETFNWRERLQLQHTKNFRTYYMANYQRTNLPGAYIHSYRGEVGADHRLYKSLRTHLDVHGRRTQYVGLREDVVGATGRVDYRKRTGAGVLTAGYSRTLDRFERTGGTGSQPVLDEPITLEFGTVQYLENANINPASVIVTDPANEVTYVEGFDYQIVQSGDRVGIELLPGGLLSEGDTVLVDYQYEYDSDFDYISDDQMFHIRHDFQKLIKGLSLYYRWHDLATHQLPDDRDLRILEYTDQVAGMKYRFWKKVEWTEEYREYNSLHTNYRQIRSQLDGSHRLSPRLRWGWNMGMLNTEYVEGIPGDGTDADYLFAGTRFTGSILRNGYWSVEGRAQEETGLTERTLFGALAKLGFRWRKIRMETGAKYEHYDVYDNERDRTHVFVQVARLF